MNFFALFLFLGFRFSRDVITYAAERGDMAMLSWAYETGRCKLSMLATALGTLSKKVRSFCICYLLFFEFE